MKETRYFLAVVGNLWEGSVGETEYSITEEMSQGMDDVKARRIAGDFEYVSSWEVRKIETTTRESVVARKGEKR